MVPELAFHTVSAAELAQLECVSLGVVDAMVELALPSSPVLALRDLEGTTVATWRATSWPAQPGISVCGSVEMAGTLIPPTYSGLRPAPAAIAATFNGAAVTAIVGFAPPPDDTLTELSEFAAGPLLFLAAAGGVRSDDAAHHRAIRAWEAASERYSATLALSPLWADAPDSVYARVAATYGADEIVRARNTAPSSARGAVVLFTGLSGSGKSTIAAQLVSMLTERDERTVTLLDGDVVRTQLSSELGFSKHDRDLNVRRIGWVAAEVAKHGGVAVAAPIAPYAETRAAVRAVVEQQSGPGSFLLVHVATPLVECERRDRKGLYAKARAGTIPEFTGISDPYEEPIDADITVDTTTVSAADAALTVLLALHSAQR